MNRQAQTVRAMYIPRRRTILVRSILFVQLCLLLSACSQESEDQMADPPENVTFPLRVRAEIDGRSEFRIQGQMVWWHHFTFEAPGMWGDDQPTFLNGEEWWPMWALDELKDCNCSSTKEALLRDPLKSDGSTISLSVTSARGSVRIVQQPSAGNNFTASIEFDDPDPNRDWFEVVITQN